MRLRRRPGFVGVAAYRGVGLPAQRSAALPHVALDIECWSDATDPNCLSNKHLTMEGHRLGTGRSFAGRPRGIGRPRVTGEEQRDVFVSLW